MDGMIPTWRRVGAGFLAAGCLISLNPAALLAANSAYVEASDQGCTDAVSCGDGCMEDCVKGCGSGCCDGCGDDCETCCGWGHCSAVWGEFLYLHATGVDMVHAQQQNLPLWRILGGTRTEIESGVSIVIQDSLGQLCEKIETELAAGCCSSRPRTARSSAPLTRFRRCENARTLQQDSLCAPAATSLPFPSTRAPPPTSRGDGSRVARAGCGRSKSYPKRWGKIRRTDKEGQAKG